MDRNLSAISRTLTKLSFPKKFAVEICAECNLACTMCHHPFMQRPKGVMPFALWKKCADEIARESPATECWFSFCGEPLLEPELLLDMLKYGKQVGLQSLNVNTNGMLLTPDLGEQLLDSGVDLVVIGIDGHSAEVYEQVRVNGDRETLYSNVNEFLAGRMLRDAGPEIQVQFIEMEENAHELNSFKEYWLSRGAVVKARNMLSWGGTFDAIKTEAEDRIACPWALTMMHVFWDGRVPRCPGDTEGDEGPGNVWQNSLVELWDRMGHYREMHLSHQFDQLPERCATCTDWMTGSAERIRPVSGPFSSFYHAGV
ncbi:MAG: radical SAM protein [Rhodothermales bacterium]|nr:radical SAM protein [Rhodothermales bacterium]